MDYVTEIAIELAGRCRPQGFVPVYVALLRELTYGLPVTLQALADAARLPIEEVCRLLREAPNTEYDLEGRIIGHGITLRQTPHAFEVDGRQLYTWCALDALMFPAVIGRCARVRSLCPETGVPVSLTAHPHQLREVQPAGVAVSLVVPRADTRSSFCCHVHFFASGAAADRWVQRHPGVEVLSVEAAFCLGQEIARRLALGTATDLA